MNFNSLFVYSSSYHGVSLTFLEASLHLHVNTKAFYNEVQYSKVIGRDTAICSSTELGVSTDHAHTTVVTDVTVRRH